MRQRLLSEGSNVVAFVANSTPSLADTRKNCPSLQCASIQDTISADLSLNSVDFNSLEDVLGRQAQLMFEFV